jgi:hypothetical protein
MTSVRCYQVCARREWTVACGPSSMPTTTRATRGRAAATVNYTRTCTSQHTSCLFSKNDACDLTNCAGLGAFTAACSSAGATMCKQYGS